MTYIEVKMMHIEAMKYIKVTYNEAMTYIEGVIIYTGVPVSVLQIPSRSAIRTDKSTDS
jgi:hypothetical protein